jgi:hypothetical protein
LLRVKASGCISGQLASTGVRRAFTSIRIRHRVLCPVNGSRKLTSCRRRFQPVIARSALHPDLLGIYGGVIGGQEAEVGGGAGPVLHGAGERGDVEAGGRRGWSVEDDRALLVDPVRWGAARVRRPRPPLRLSLEERETISRGLAQHKTFTAIAAELGRSASTVSREVARNSGPNGYRAARADRLAVQRMARPRPGKLAEDPTLRRYVEDKLRLRWSPQQISRRLITEFPHDASMRVSHETIYTSLFVQTTAVLRTELTAHLRTRRVRRRPQRRAIPRWQSRRIPNMVSIRQRPDEVLDRQVPGHWESQ